MDKEQKKKLVEFLADHVDSEDRAYYEIFPDARDGIDEVQLAGWLMEGLELYEEIEDVSLFVFDKLKGNVRVERVEEAIADYYREKGEERSRVAWLAFVVCGGGLLGALVFRFCQEFIKWLF